MTDPDVLIAGGGLSGLACAHHLRRRGLTPLVLEAADAPGGRARTDRAEGGFRLDRGFQVFLTAYPEAQALLDYDALELRYFDAGALVHTKGRFHRVADPLRHPQDVLPTLAAPVGSLLDKLKIAALRMGVTFPSQEALFERPERTTHEVLRGRWRFSDAVIERFFRPFLGGITLDGSLSASSRMFEFVFRMFALGRAAVPASGMEAIPHQLASGLPDGALRTEARVASVTSDSVTLEGGETLAGRAVVVATEAPEAARLLDDDALPAARRSVRNLYFAANDPPVEEPVLVLNGEPGGGPINNLTVMSRVAPTYAPDGRDLVSVAVLEDDAPADEDALERAVRQQLGAWFGRETTSWQHLRTYAVDYALPDQTPPFLSPPDPPVRHAGSGCYLAGDHRATASINGAFHAGRRAAGTLARELA